MKASHAVSYHVLEHYTIKDTAMQVNKSRIHVLFCKIYMVTAIIPEYFCKIYTITPIVFNFVVKSVVNIFVPKYMIT